jgi:GT2 family glycosyltransferase
MTHKSNQLVQPTTFLVICTRNRREHLINLFQNLSKCEPKPDATILVDSSDSPLTSPEVAYLARELGTPVQYVTSGSGLPFQRNVAIDLIAQEKTAPSLVAFLDDDVEVPDDYFSVGAKILKANPGIVGIGAFDLNYPGTPDTLLRRLFMLSTNRPAGQLLRSGIATLRPPKLPLELTTWMPGHSVIFRWKPLRATRFDDSVRMYGEDVEMQLRVSNHGNLAMSRTFWVRHFPSSINRDQVRTINAYSDGFRWSLALQHPKLVSKSAVVFTTLVLYVGEIGRGVLSGDSVAIKGAQGHLDFLRRLTSGAETRQLR